jgi:Prenyltransferase and squalene oxidase repeat
MREKIESAIHASASYLVDHQAADGHWEDYSLPVGPSDAWVTAYVGLALSQVTSHEGAAAAMSAATRAASWLVTNRPYAAGWGYNGRTGPDADSTAHVIALLHATGTREEERDSAWLLRRWQPDGGFATFEGPEAWGKAHADITPICFRVLPRHHRAKLEGNLIGFLTRMRRDDGSWPSYWWRTGFYSTYACLALLRDLKFEPIPSLVLSGMKETNSISSAFDLAFATGIAALQKDDLLCQSLAKELLRHQNTDGSWAGGKELRVTETNCSCPWEDPRGQLYCDLKGLISTATCLAILSRL